MYKLQQTTMSKPFRESKAAREARQAKEAKDARDTRNTESKLIEAAKSGKLSDIQALFNAELEYERYCIDTLMKNAIISGNLDSVQYLCNFNVDLYKDDYWCLTLAQNYRHMEIIKFLKDAMSEVWRIERNRQKVATRIQEKNDEKMDQILGYLERIAGAFASKNRDDY